MNHPYFHQNCHRYLYFILNIRTNLSQYYVLFTSYHISLTDFFSVSMIAYRYYFIHYQQSRKDLMCGVNSSFIVIIFNHRYATLVLGADGGTR